jgi:chemotaxis protein methyltransferase CheR
MNPLNFEFLAVLLKQASGLALGLDKGYLLESRLSPIAKKHGCNNLDELVGRLRTGSAKELASEVVEAMTTNESFFFRDVKPFEAFRDKILPTMLQHRATTRTLRIWCAAASTGQEPYSLAMVLHEEANKLAGWNCTVLGTDISKEALTRAASGVYTQFEVQRGLTIQRLMTHFEKKDANWQIKPDLRRKVQFRSFNLLDDPRSLGRFDIVFCRNVLIYFDQPTKARVLDSIARVMNDNGVLLLGGAETVFGVSDTFKPWGEQHGAYCLAAPRTAAAAVSFQPLPVAVAK